MANNWNLNVNIFEALASCIATLLLMSHQVLASSAGSKSASRRLNRDQHHQLKAERQNVAGLVYACVGKLAKTKDFPAQLVHYPDVFKCYHYVFSFSVVLTLKNLPNT